MKKNEIKDLLEVNEKIVPQLSNMLSVSSERGILSILLNSPEEFHLIKNSLDSQDFGHEVNRFLWDTIVKISDNKNNGNYVTKNQIFYEGEGSPEFKSLSLKDLIEALSIVPYNKISTKSLIEILKTKRIQRERWHEACETAEEILKFEGKDVEELLTIGFDKQLDLVVKNQSALDSIYKMGSKLKERLIERENNKDAIESFSFNWFPEISQMMDASVHELIIGCARPKTGKSILLNQLFMNAAVWGSEGNGKGIIPCGYVDTEMEDYQQENRGAACLAGVDELKIRKGLYISNKEDQERVYASAHLMSKGEAYWKRIPMFSTKSIIGAFKTLRVLYGIKIGFFDQIKDPLDSATANSEKEHQRIGWLCLALKHLCEQESMTIIAMQQLGRSGTDTALRSEYVDPSIVMADSDRALRFASKCFYLAKMQPKEIEKFGGVTKCGNVVFNLFANRSGESHSLEGGVGLLFRKRLTRFEEMGTLGDKDGMPKDV